MISCVSAAEVIDIKKRAHLAFPAFDDPDVKPKDGKLHWNQELPKNYVLAISMQKDSLNKGLSDKLLIEVIEASHADDKFYAWLEKNPKKHEIWGSMMRHAMHRYLVVESAKGEKQYQEAKTFLREKLFGGSDKITKTFPELSTEYNQLVDEVIKRTKLKKLMDESGIRYEIDKNGDASIVFNYTDVERKQQVWVGADVNPVGNYKIRKVFSYAYMGETEPDASVLKAALEHNRELATSRWSINQSKKNGRYFFVLTALVPETADAETLASIIRGVASRADNFQKDYFE